MDDCQHVQRIELLPVMRQDKAAEGLGLSEVSGLMRSHGAMQRIEELRRDILRRQARRTSGHRYLLSGGSDERGTKATSALPKWPGGPVPVCARRVSLRSALPIAVPLCPTDALVWGWS